jgi:alginate O-acetyltransferase complex protein AlgI
VLFNSYAFILLFLPAALAGFFVLARASRRAAALWLGLASLFFYGWWNPAFVALLIASILGNFGAGRALARLASERARRALLAAAIAADLAVLGYFKYANFFLATLGAGALDIVLPLGVSFFTFTQIAFLVDVRRGLAREPDFVHYLLFVTFFPHLIAGPVLHHKEMMPQFADPAIYRWNAADFAAGLALFAIGLAKKVLLADSFAEYASPIFDAAREGARPGFVAAWTAAFAYSFQIYFDFSGYSDMALGLARLFGVRFPLNFASPYQAPSLVEFWRRWHMTLSRFLRDYLYIPLGGNRKGPARRHLNLAATMLLGGLWHGAAWSFVAWGALHGLLLALNHAWQDARARLGAAPGGLGAPGRIAGVALTFLAVTVAWVFFRAEGLAAALRMLDGMAAVSEAGGLAAGIAALADRYAVPPHPPGEVAALFLLGGAVVWLLPASQTIVARLEPRPGAGAEAAIGALAVAIFLLAAIAGSRGVSEFIYFNF